MSRPHCPRLSAARFVLPLLVYFTIGLPVAGYGLEAWYATGSIGKAWWEETSLTSVVVRSPAKQYDTEYGLSAALGYAFRWTPFRVEGEFTYYHADGFVIPSQRALAAHQTLGRHGTDTHYVGMANLYYDARFSGGWDRWKPYIGVGAGVSRNTMQGPQTGGVTSPPTPENNTNLAYQVKGGLGYSLTDTLDLVVGYRYFRTVGRTFQATPELPGPHEVPTAIHLLEVGLRYDF